MPSSLLAAAGYFKPMTLSLGTEAVCFSAKSRHAFKLVSKRRSLAS